MPVLPGEMRDKRTYARRRLSPGRVGLVALPALCLSVMVGCAPQFYTNFYKKSASRETEKILFRKSGEVGDLDPEAIEIGERERGSLDGLGKNRSAAEYLGEVAPLEKGARILELSDALDLAIHHNRTYLTRKETIYLQALDLTLTRYELSPMAYARLALGAESDALTGDRPPRRIERQVEREVIDPLTGTAAINPATGAVVTEVVTEIVEREVDGLISTNTFTRQQSVGFTMLQRTGARLAVDFTSDFLRFVGGERSINESRLAVTLAQPLLKGGGFKVTLENLTQSERDLLYSLRDFSNFRREFIVDIVSRFYGVLQARDTVQNNWVAYEGFRKSVEQETALAEEGRRTPTELGLLRQNMLQAEGRWVDAIRDYRQQLDELKIELGLPVEENVILDEAELRRLVIEDPGIRRDQAVQLALATRLDLITASDRVDDAGRRIEVAKIELLPGLDAVGSAEVLSDPGDIAPELNWERRRWAAGLELDLPLDRKEERNFFRSVLIEKEQAEREEILAKDEVRLEIFNDWRSLEQAKRNFEIAELGVQLAERRLEEQLLLSDLGQGEARDLVEARNDLVNSQNQRTSRLVDHTLARLRLWQDMGVLYINSDGSWVEELEQEGTSDE